MAAGKVIAVNLAFFLSGNKKGYQIITQHKVTKLKKAIELGSRSFTVMESWNVYGNLKCPLSSVKIRAYTVHQVDFTYNGAILQSTSISICIHK